MKISIPEILLDSHTFLPPDGEDDIEILLADNYLTLNIFYETEASESVTAKNTIRLRRPSYLIKNHSLDIAF